MNRTQRLERPGAHQSAVTGNHIYEKKAIGTATIPAVGGAGKFAGLAASALTRKAWGEDRGRAPNAKQGDIVRKQDAEIAIGDLRDRASLDAALKDVDAVRSVGKARWADMPASSRQTRQRLECRKVQTHPCHKRESKL
jgi:hypothetical protein